MGTEAKAASAYLEVNGLALVNGMKINKDKFYMVSSFIRTEHLGCLFSEARPGDRVCRREGAADYPHFLLWAPALRVIYSKNVRKRSHNHFQHDD